LAGGGALGLVAAGAVVTVSGAGCTALVQFDDFGDASLGSSTNGAGSDSGQHGGTTIIEPDGAVVTVPGDDDGTDGSMTTPTDSGGGQPSDGGPTVPPTDGATTKDAGVDACVASTQLGPDDVTGTSFGANAVCEPECVGKAFSRYCPATDIDQCQAPTLDGGGSALVGCGSVTSGAMELYRCPDGCVSNSNGDAFCNPCTNKTDGFYCQPKSGYQLSYKALLVRCAGGSPITDQTQVCSDSSCNCGSCKAQ
jgi:hypothetical protein